VQSAACECHSKVAATVALEAALRHTKFLVWRRRSCTYPSSLLPTEFPVLEVDIEVDMSHVHVFCSHSDSKAEPFDVSLIKRRVDCSTISYLF
jgi:hypothetical protein